MKKFKKFLSILIAATMVFSLFAINAAAEGESDYTAEFSLSFKVIRGSTDGGKTNGTLIAQGGADAIAYALPGDNVLVTTHLKTDYLTGITQYPIFYDRAIFEPYSTPETFTVSNVFHNGVLRSYCSVNGSHESTQIGDQPRKNAYGPYFGTAFQDQYTYSVVMMTTVKSVADQNGTTQSLVDEDLTTLHLVVKDGVEVGTSSRIFMDSAVLKSDEYPQAAFQVGRWKIADPVFNVSNHVGYGQTINLDAASIGVSIEEFQAVDATELQAQIARATEITTKYPNPLLVYSNWNTVNTPLNNAKAIDQFMVYSEENQAAVDAAALALKNALDGLKPRTFNPTVLKNKIAEIEDTWMPLEDMLTPSPYADLMAKYDEAVAFVSGTLTMLDQEKAAEFVSDLDELIAALTFLPWNIDDLVEAIAAGEAKITEGGWTTASAEALQDAIDAGKDLLLTAADEDEDAVTAAANAIYDAITALVPAATEPDPADYEALDAAIAAAEALDPDDYVDFSAVATALEAAKAVSRDLTEDDQNIIDSAKQALLDAMGDLAEKVYADYTALDAAIALVPTYGEIDYEDAAWAAYTAALDAANDVERGLTNDYQDTIDALATALTTAYDALDDNIKYAVEAYEAVDAAIALAPPEADRALYTTETLAVLDAAINVVEPGKRFSESDEVYAWAQAITDAVEGLEYNEANTTALEAALAIAKGKNEALYTEESYATLTEAITAAEALLEKEDLNITDQDDIDSATAALNSAIGSLVFLGADVSELEALVAAADADTESYYTPESWAEYATLIDEARLVIADAENLTVEDQPVVDALRDAILAVVLVDADADYTAVNALITEAGKLTPASDYVASYLEEVNALVANKPLDLKARDQEILNAYAQELETLLNNKQWSPFNYNTFNALLAQVAGLNASDYTAESWGALQAAINAVPLGQTNEFKAEVTAKVTAAINAFLALVPDTSEPGDADYTALDAAIAAAEALDPADYVDFTDVEATLAAAKAVARDLTEDDQGIINAAADALNAAIDALEPYVAAPADYTALNAAIAAAEALVPYNYVDFSGVAAALAAAKAVDKNLTEDDQNIIDEAKDALLAAIDALVEVEITGKVTNVSYVKSLAISNDFNFTVQGRATNVKIYSPDGGTRTYDRHSSKVTIASFDADDNPVSSFSANLAYEVWTIRASLDPDTASYTAIAKFAETGWESRDNAYEFVVELLVYVPDYSLISASLNVEDDTKVIRGSKAPATIVTNKDASRVRLVYADGGTITLSATRAVADDNGILTWTTPNLCLDFLGENAITIQACYKSVWYTIGTLDYTVVKS